MSTTAQTATLTNPSSMRMYHAFAYANTAKELEYGTVVIEHHEKAREIVNKDKVLKRECRDVAFALAQCLRHKKLF